MDQKDLFTILTLSDHNTLDNRSQWPENRTLDYNPLWDISNFCRHNSKWSEILHVQAFFALRSQPSLCESCSTSQILLAHSGPHPPHAMSPDPCSDFSSSSFDPSDHSPLPIAPNPLAAAPDPVPQPSPYIPSSLHLSEGEGEVTQSCPTLCDPVDCSSGHPLCDPVDCSPPGSSRRRYWSRLSFPSPGGFPNPGIKPRSPTLEADALTSEPPGEFRRGQKEVGDTIP